MADWRNPKYEAHLLIIRDDGATDSRMLVGMKQDTLEEAKEVAQRWAREQLEEFDGNRCSLSVFERERGHHMQIHRARRADRQK